LDGVNEVMVEDMERLICQLPTVLKCAISVNDWGAIEEIHVLTNLDRTPKQIVRDVESALLANWNLRVDHKRISIAQIMTDGPSASSGNALSRRLKIREYHMDADSLKQTAYTRVVFTWTDGSDAQFKGEWSGRYLSSQYYHVMAWAAIEAINGIPGINGPLVLTELRPLTLANRTVIVVALSQYDRRRRETLLVGTAEERGDGQGASVRAVLDAINRKVAISQPE